MFESSKLDGPGIRRHEVHPEIGAVLASGVPPRFLAGLSFLGLQAQEEARLRRFLDDERKRRRSADPAAR